jgi:lipopolysaccharide transport system ATP-binding protein
MSDIAVRVENLSKRYRLGAQASYHRLSEMLSGMGRATVGMGKRLLARAGKGADADRAASPGDFWALRDVSFEVRQGEVVGIIGRNGAGKSTLLKILSRVTEPTSGRFGVRGRVGSLLEVGTGFHPELTGRENIYLNGSVLGMSRSAVRQRFDEIAAFADIDAFLDTPVKRYSSGMFVRLAFAVAAHLEPDILVVDEVLAVGDAAFQKKCLGRMKDIAYRHTTVLFVSHNMPAVAGFCGRAIWLENGRVREEGQPGRVVADYLANGGRERTSRRWRDGTDAPAGPGVRLLSASVSACNGTATDCFTVQTPLRFEFEAENHLPGTVLNFSVVLNEVERGCIFNTGSDGQCFPAGVIQGSFVVPGELLNDGCYSVRVLLVKDTSVALLDEDDVLTFQVHDIERNGHWFGRWIGAVRPSLTWEVGEATYERVGR